ncbi:MAG: histidine kinase dimerization/phospho-acceptor domain-containing protein [Ardenticatenia bacterium]|nr:histidine kinase dimerization/phospho-acceptor domain-containing protein [Ardenticatenia bacterium]
MIPWWFVLPPVAVVLLLLILLWQSRQRERRWQQIAHRHRQQANGDSTDLLPWLPAMFEHLPAPLFVLDQQGLVVATNAQAAHMFGPSRAGEPLIFRLRHHAAVELVEHVVRDGQPAMHLLTLEEGTVFHAYAWPWPLTKPPQGAILFLNDVTELVHAVRARRELAANLSHELRTPLASLHLLAETIVQDDGEDSHLVRHLARRILNEVQATVALVEDMMALSMIDSGRVPLRLERLPPG